MERVAAILTANFDTDVGLLCTAKSVTAPATVTILKRMDINLHIAANGADRLPALCVYANTATTQAEMAGRRHTHATINIDYMDRFSVTVLETGLKQAELAAEAILLSVDRLGLDNATGVWEAGGGLDSVVVTFNDREDAPEGEYQRLVTVSVPVTDQDEV